MAAQDYAYGPHRGSDVRNEEGDELPPLDTSSLWEQLNATGRYCIHSATALDFDRHRILDWVAYHYLIGFDCFLLIFDIEKSNLTDAPTLAVYKALVASPLVTALNGTIFDRFGDSEGKGMTLQTVTEYLPRAEYLGMIDVDEYYVTESRALSSAADVPLHRSRFHKFLHGVLDGNAMGIHSYRWTFGTNGWVSPPAEDTPEFHYFTERARLPHPKGKVLLYVPAALNATGVVFRLHGWHRFDNTTKKTLMKLILANGAEISDEATELERNSTEAETLPLSINHYVTGSLSECQYKLLKGSHHRDRSMDCELYHPGAQLYKAEDMSRDFVLDRRSYITRVWRDSLFPQASKR